MQIVLGDNVHELSYHIYLEEEQKYLKITPAGNFTLYAI